MKKGEEIIVGRMGQQPMHIADTSVDPQHAVLRMTGEGVFRIDDNNSAKGTFVFGMRIKRKTIYNDTPIILGSLKTTVRQLLQDASEIDLESTWNNYNSEKRKWERMSMLVNYLRVLPSILTMLLSMFVGKGLSNDTRMIITVVLTITVLVISMIASDKIMARKNLRMAELNAEMQEKYVCPQCHRFLSLTPYKILKQQKYCPNPLCNYPLP